MGTGRADAATLTSESAADERPERSWPIVVRRATPGDRESVLAFATRTWGDWDYIPHAWPVWLDALDGAFLVATVGLPAAAAIEAPADADGNALEVGRVVAITRVAVLSPTEAWLEGIRVDPRVRGMGVARDLQVAELHWVAAQHAAVLRYATGASNEASHRLGARDDITLIARFRAWWWSATGVAEDHDREPSAFDAHVREATTARRRAALEMLAAEGLIVGAAGADSLWRMIDGDPTFNCGQRLYEPRPWALQELTAELLHRHTVRGEVIAEDPDAAAILVGRQLPAEDSSVRLALLVGSGEAAARLAGRIREISGDAIRFRAPVDEPMTHGHEQLFRDAGFVTPDWELHILARSMDDAHPIPTIDPTRVALEDPPEPITPPRW